MLFSLSKSSSIIARCAVVFPCFKGHLSQDFSASRRCFWALHFRAAKGATCSLRPFKRQAVSAICSILTPAPSHFIEATYFYLN